MGFNIVYQQFRAMYDRRQIERSGERLSYLIIKKQKLRGVSQYMNFSIKYIIKPY